MAKNFYILFVILSLIHSEDCFENWKEINFICSEAGTIRGNHYHENTDELFIILEGKIKIILQNVLGKKDLENKKETFIFIKF